MKTFAVITPTIGSEHLRQNILSLQDQDCNHYIVVDGYEYWDKISDIILGIKLTRKLKIINLQENVGKGWYGHRVYAAASFLVNEDVLCYLDEDNWAEPNYIEAFQRTLSDPKYNWAYTLRNIVTPTGEFVCPDNCESLGHWPVAFDPSRHHIDTGCFAVPRQLAVKVGHNWYGQWGADRQFYKALTDLNMEYGCTTQHTLNYRIGSETNRATVDMFTSGNLLSLNRFTGEKNYPWHEQRSPTKQPVPLWSYQTTIPRLPL